MSRIPRFAELAADPDTALDLVALAIAAEFRDVDAPGALARLDALGTELSNAASQTSGTPEAAALVCGQILGAAHGFAGDLEHYDDPDNSMLDLVLTRRRGLPILLSIVYVEAARRAAAVSACRVTSWSATLVPIPRSCWIPSPAADVCRATSCRTN
jgi:regulator of sirC expression with transglutaminase-like and TPR domain